MHYLYHTVQTAPRSFEQVSQRLNQTANHALQASGGALYGIWRSQIGRPRDELSVITVWPDVPASEHVSATMFDDDPQIAHHHTQRMYATLRPTDSTPPTRQGNYAFRHFDTPAAHWDEFLRLCASAWPEFERAYDSQVIGLWRYAGTRTDSRQSLLLTRRPSLAMWERSKLPEGEDEAALRRTLSRRYDLCDATVVYTATLLTATDRSDTTRWA